MQGPGKIVTAALAALCCAALAAPAALAAGNVTTAGYNTLRDDWDSAEPALTPAAVESSTFGQLFEARLHGAIYSQPLVYEGRVIVTTEEANAYALNPASGEVEWQRSFGKPFKAATIGCSDLKPLIGSTSTPVIDPSTGTVYLTTRLQVGKGLAGSHWYLQAISAATGEERPGFPVQISGTPYNTPGVPFDEGHEMQRPALLLLNGVVYVAFASDCDITPYRGIVAGYNASTGALTTMWSDESGAGTDENSQAGIWQSGGGLVSDVAGRIIVTSGNGVSPSPAPSSKPPATLSESVIGLTVGSGGQLSPTDFFAPSNAPTLDQNDEDLGSGGPIALPTEAFGTKADPHLLVQVGKDGRVFLLDADSMGGYRQGAKGGDAVLQELGPFDGVWGHPAAYGGQGGWVYILESAGGGYLRAFDYGVSGGGLPQLTPVATSAESFGYTSGSPLVTSNGTTAGTAIVWVVYTSGASGAGGQLRAYNAAPAGGTLQLLWSGRIGRASKFATPTAYEGRVYVGTRNGDLIAFGSSSGAPVKASALEAGEVPVGQSTTVEVPVEATKDVTIAGPITATGVEDANGPQPTTGVTSRTAGPTRIPPSGTTSLAPGVLSIAAPAPGAALAAGTTLHLKVTFRPRRRGPVVASLEIPTSAGTRSVAVSGYGTAPGLLVSARPLDFGTIATRAGGKRISFTIANSWSRPERITAAALPHGAFAVSGLPAIGTVLEPRQSVTASVLFDPSRAGRDGGAIAIATDHGSVRLELSGRALAGSPRLVAAPLRIDLGAVRVGRRRSALLTVANAGTVPLEITRAIAPLGPFEVPFPIPEGISLDPGARLRVRVTFAPSRRGRFTGRYLLRGSDRRGPTVVTFTGRGV